ncbi:MAG: hypothetical protein SFV54_26575 [Bryobacteraceae bacterium]|nr:hypothetical protein [Bryobacteraceae bacterium]
MKPCILEDVHELVSEDSLLFQRQRQLTMRGAQLRDKPEQGALNGTNGK